ncbi:MAG: trypsin-like peptidase domain-containing protein [Chloroflexota bacterium]|nr:trypsin-like peptidase domain-containing protein [Chloroflexota bacterium]
MAIQFRSDDDFPRLTQIISRIPSWRQDASRIAFIDQTFGTMNRADDIRYNLYLNGDPLTTAINTVMFLLTFGKIDAEREALSILVKSAVNFTGQGDNAEFLKRVLNDIADQTKVQADRAAPIPPRVMGNWNGEQDELIVQEKLIGDNALRHINILLRAIDAAKAVVHITLPTERGDAYGTGFMIAPTLLMTNNHVLKDAAEAGRAKYKFNFERGLDDKVNDRDVRFAKYKAGGIFETHDKLDYAIVELDDVPPNTFTPLPLRTAMFDQFADARIGIIQHPSGEEKQISLQNNRVEYADANILQYTTTTLPGSSGSPVFDGAFQFVVALHHSGGSLPEPGSTQRYNRNEGTAIGAIVEHLRGNQPQVVGSLKIV